MRTRALPSIGVVASLGLLACGSVDDASLFSVATGGTSATGGVSGATGGVRNTTGGMSGMSGMSGTTGGMSGTTGGTASAGKAGGSAQGGTSAAGATGVGGTSGCPDGCVELEVPFAAYNTAQAFEIYLAMPADFSAGVVSVKLRSLAGKAGGIHVVLKNAETNQYAFAQTPWLGLDTTVKSEWTTVTWDASATLEIGATAFNKAAVAILAVQISAGVPWYSDTPANTIVDNAALVNPTVVQIDEILVRGVTGVGSYEFTANATDIHLGNYQPIVGSTVTWLPPG